MKKLTGLSACSGVVAGNIFCVSERTVQAMPVYSITARDIQAEKKRLKAALQAAQSQLAALLTEHLPSDIRPNAPERAILETHQAMLTDEDFTGSVCAEIEVSLMNAEYALQRKLDEAANLLAASGDTYLCERAVDIRDAYEPVFAYLAIKQSQIVSRFAAAPQGALLTARSFSPSEALEIKRTAPCGIIMEEGGITGHIAIMARAWNIPMLAGASGITAAAKTGMYAVLDSANQTVILEPDDKTIAQMQQRLSTSQIGACSSLQDYAMVYTQDGSPVQLYANIAFAEDTTQPPVRNAAGVGLFRSEFLFLGRSNLPAEAEQYEIYRAVLERMGKKPVIIRTLDAGADKMLKEQEDLAERNALLGLRGIRYCLARPEIFKTQLRALLRAGCYGNLHLLIPMVSCVKEITAVRQLIEEVERECERKSIPYKKQIPLGIMIEVPSAAAVADLYAPAVDFFSIGTNDLIQYTVAADRENKTVAHLTDYFHPAVLRLIRHVIETEPLLHRTGDLQGGFVSMCGEMASAADAVPLLLGMGLRRFSMAAQKIPEIAQRIASIRLSDAEALYEAVSRLDSSEEIRRQITQRFPLR